MRQIHMYIHTYIKSVRPKCSNKIKASISDAWKLCNGNAIKFCKLSHIFASFPINNLSFTSLLLLNIIINIIQESLNVKIVLIELMF